MKTYQFKLYEHKRNKHLHRIINAASSIYNHSIALHKRYYRMFGKHLNKYKLQKHIAKLRQKNEYWQLVGSQAAQDIADRIERGYQLFFKHHKKGVRPPNFRKRIKYRSITLKQAGYKFLDNNQVKIGKRVYKFWKSRDIKGKIKTVTVKRNPLGEIFIFVTTDLIDNKIISMSGKNAGFDFGLIMFLTCSDSTEIKSPLFFKQCIKDLKKANRNHSRKEKGSNNREKARKNLARIHEKIANQRKDWFWKLAHKLTDKFDYLYFETLNLKGMQRLWGRKITDLAMQQFLKILEYVADQKNKVVSYVDRWLPSSKTCHVCDYVLDELLLETRYWCCPSCSTNHGRDDNASKVILKAGTTALREGDVRLSQTAIPA